MVDPIRSSSTRSWNPADDDDEARRRTAATRPRPAALPEPPDLPDVHGALLARAAKQASAPNRAADATVAKTDQDTAVQGRLEAFFSSAKPVYRLPEGGEVAVAVGFRMTTSAAVPPQPTPADLRYVAQETLVNRHDPELRAIAARYGVRGLDEMKVGRGAPSQIQKLTQALIDEGKLPPAVPGGPSGEQRIRRMMSEYGIGLDCAGYTQQAFLAARGVTRAQAGFAPAITSEDLSRISRAHFSRVDPQDSRAGDIFAMGPPPGDSVGHRVIVVDRHDASPEELKRYCGSGDGAVLAGGEVSVLTVDSSWGSGGDPDKGGVGRQTWLYEATSKQWGTVVPAPLADGKQIPATVYVASMPYDGHHPLLGIYHYSEKH
jgi:hypothetical protein